MDIFDLYHRLHQVSESETQYLQARVETTKARRQEQVRFIKSLRTLVCHFLRRSSTLPTSWLAVVSIQTQQAALCLMGGGGCDCALVQVALVRGWHEEHKQRLHKTYEKDAEQTRKVR